MSEHITGVISEVFVSIHQIHVFISHSWKYSTHYETIEEWIFKEKWAAGQASLEFRNFSIPQDDPIHNAPTDNALQKAIYNQIMRSHIVIIPTGMYTTRSKWIKKEVDGAKHYQKPIIAVNPWGQERKAIDIQNVADKIVGWNKKPLIEAVWSLHRK
jgi:hypothetical protein